MNKASEIQPKPLTDRENQVNVGELVIKDIQDRIKTGVQKYGTPLQTNNGRDALIDAYQEVLDLAQYLCQEIQERKEKINIIHGQETTLEEFFIQSFTLISHVHHNAMMDKGFWDEPRRDGELVALMHSELSELLESLRHGNPASDKIPEFSNAEEEMADIILRIMDMSEAKGWRIPEALIAKMEYNRTRPHKHGKAF